MAKNYLIYPCKTLRMTQSYTGTTSHLPHMTGTPKDYPWDEGCSDSGRDGFYCPCDEMKIVKIYGVGNSGTNTIWLESTSPVYFADGTKDYTCGHIIHPNDSDIKDLKVGQKFKRKELICYEGTDGGASGNHFHISFGKGKFKGTGWVKNSKGKYVLTTTKTNHKPEELFYIDEDFTKVVNNKGLKFKTMPEITPPGKVTGVKLTPKEKSITVKWTKDKEATGYCIYTYSSTKKEYTRVGSTTDTTYNVTGLSSGKSYKIAVRSYIKYNKEMYYGKMSSVVTTKTTKPKSKYATGKYKVNTTALNVRAGAGASEKKVGVVVLGKKITVDKVDGDWGRIGKNRWVNLNYCKKI